MLTGRKSQNRQGELNSATTVTTKKMTIVTRGIFSLTSANCTLYPFMFILLRDGIKKGRKKERKEKYEKQAKSTGERNKLTHCGRVTQIYFFNTVKLGTSTSIYIYIYIYIYDIISLRVNYLTLILLTWRKW